jgi:hypothetical protein
MPARQRASLLSFGLTLVLFVGLAGAALRAWAGGGGEPPIEAFRHHHACRFDIRRFCADVERGRPTRECLERHEAELTDGCRRALADRGPRR